MKYIIEIEHLHKSFGEVKAVQDLSFHVKEGELFAFLGVNGAGKSTTISILCGQLAVDSGTVTVDGRNIDGSMAYVKQELGVVFQNCVRWTAAAHRYRQSPFAQAEHFDIG